MFSLSTFSSRLERGLKRLRDTTTPIDLTSPDPPKAIYLDNYVTTVCILQNEEHERISIKDLCMAAGGACKLKPKKMPASIIRFGDDALSGNTTALIFKKGKINVVGANGLEHARMATQEYRLFIESVPMVMRDGKRLKIDTLEGKTTWKNFGLHNVVSHTSLGIRPDLKKLTKLFPDASEWDPKTFPAAIFRLWLKKKSECTCDKKSENDSCGCNLTCLVFDTSKIVVTGTKSGRDTILASECIRKFFIQHPELHFKGAILPSYLRYEARKKYKLQKEEDEIEIEFISLKKPTSLPKKQSDNLGDIFDAICGEGGEDSNEDGDTDVVLPDFIQCCMNGQLGMVQSMIDIYGKETLKTHVDTQGRNAYEYLTDELALEKYTDPVYMLILNVLKSCME